MKAPTADGIRAVLLDLYGTLVDLDEEKMSAGFDMLAVKLDLPVRPGELYGRHVELISRDEPVGTSDTRFVSYRASWTEAGETLLTPYGVADAGRQFADTYTSMHVRAVAFPEVHRAVEELRDGFQVVVVANADRDIASACLRRNGLSFDVVVDSESVRCYKPNAEIFHEACSRLSVEPTDCAMVGDTPSTDIAGAQRLGMRAIWINRARMTWPPGVTPPDAVVSNLSELAAVCTDW